MRVRYVLPLVATVIASAACGGGDSNSTESDPESSPASADTEPSEDASEQEPGPVTGEPIEGPVISLFSADLGLYAIDRATDAVRDLTMDGVGFTDRKNQPIAVGDAAYMLTFRTIKGQFSSNEVGVGKVELASGAGVNLIQLVF